jgi:hypothetical protein
MGSASCTGTYIKGVFTMALLQQSAVAEGLCTYTHREPCHPPGRNHISLLGCPALMRVNSQEAPTPLPPLSALGLPLPPLPAAAELAACAPVLCGWAGPEGAWPALLAARNAAMAALKLVASPPMLTGPSAGAASPPVGPAAAVEAASTGGLPGAAAPAAASPGMAPAPAALAGLTLALTSKNTSQACCLGLYTIKRSVRVTWLVGLVGASVVMVPLCLVARPYLLMRPPPR